MFFPPEYQGPIHETSRTLSFEVVLRELNERIKMFALVHSSQEKGAL